MIIAEAWFWIKYKRINNAGLFSQPFSIIFTNGTNNSDHLCKLTCPHHNRDIQLCSQSHHIQIIHKLIIIHQSTRVEKMLFFSKPELVFTFLF